MPLLSNSHPHPSPVRVHFAEDDDNENKSRGHLSKKGNGHGDNTNDGGDNDDNSKTPDRDELRQDPALPPLPIKKVALPIVRSKIDQHEAQLLLGVDDKKFQSTKTLKVTNGSLSSHHNNNLHEISDTANSASKIPKSLKNLVVREKIHPNVNPGRRKDPTKSSSKSPTRVNAIDLSNTNPPNTKIVISRGVEMKRVDGKSDHPPQPVTYGSSSCNNNIKPRTATTTRKPASSSTAESSSSKNLKRKSITIEPPSVHPSKSKGKPSAVVATPLSQNASAPSATTGAGEGHPSIVLAESYKTLKEFLNLPPVIPVSDETRHDGQQQQEEENAEPPPTKSKPTANSYYKSKFWEYVDPNKKVPSSKPPEKPKPYDPTAVKSFIEKQKESRREKETADLKAKQEQLDKKKKHLAQLKEKCRHLVVGSGKTTPTTTPATTNTKGLKTSTTTTSGDDAYNFIRKDVLEQVLQKVTGSAPPSNEVKVIHHKPPPPSRFQYHSVRPVIKSPHRPNAQPQRRLPMSSPSSRTVTTTTSSAAVSRSSILLQEFETIVKRECINFFQTKHVATETIPQPSLPPTPSASGEKRFSEKCVATTASLGELEKSSNVSSSKSSILSDNSSIISVKLRTMHDYDAAASKIQAAFKGYKERKILKEANILPRDLLRVKKMLALKKPVGIGGSGFKISSFSSKMPEKPYDQESPSPSYSNYLKQKLGKNESTIRHGSPTVTPPTLPRPTSSSSSRKSFNEPYPMEAIQRLQQEAQVEAAAAVSRRNSLSELRKCVMLPETRPRPNLDASLLETTLTPKNSSTGLLNLRRKSESLGLGIGQPAPSISAVLFEKLKGLQSERDAITTRKSVSAMHLTPVDDDLESISSIAHPHDSQDISITDDYFGPSDSEMHHPRTLTSTPLKLLSETSLHESRQQKEHRIHHSPRKSKSPQSSREEESASTTTVETDVELGPGQGHPTTTMTTTTTPGQPSSTSALPMPALTLRYHAERERLNILEKAIQAATLYEKRQDRVAPAPVQPPPQPPVKVPTTSEIESIAKKVAEDRIKVNLAELEKEKWSNLIKQQESTQQTSSLNNNLALEVMKCQQEAAAATAEVSKLMMQVGKSFLEDRQQERIFQENRIQQQLQARINDDHVNMAAIVVAAVDEAQRIAERQRQHREALSRVTRRPHQRGEEFERVEEQEASEHQIFRFSTPSHQDVALQFPSFSSSSETPSVVGVGDDEQLEKELDQGDELSLDHLQSFVGDQPDSRFEQESSEVEMLKSLTQLSEQNDYHTSQNETPSKIEVVEESFTTKPADDQTEESVGFEASFLSEEKEPTEEGGTESSIPEVVDVDEDNRTESPLAISHIEQEEEEEEIFEHSKVESVSEVEAEVGTNISIGEFSRSKDEGDHDLASFMSDIQQSEGNDEMDKKHESQIDDNENDFIYSGAVEEEQQKDVISSPTIDQFPVSHESPGRLEEKEEDEDQGKIVPPPFNKDEEEQERSESNILVPDDKIVPIKESEDIPLFETHQASLAPPSPQEAINSVVLNQTIDPENVATSSPLEPGIVHKEGDESVPSTMDQDNNNNPESILESIGYDVDSDVGADIDVSFNADRDLSNQSGELVLSGDEEKGVAKDDDGKEEPAIKTPSSPPPSPLPIHTDHKEDGAVTPPDVSKSELMIDHLSQQTPLNVTIDNGKDNSETVVNESSPIVITLETELVKESEELSAQQLSPPPPQDFTSLLSDPENKDANSSLLSEVSDKYSESFLSDKEGEEEEADSEPRFEEESDNEESEARPGSKNAYQGERDQSPEKEENLILSPIVDSTPEDSATSSTKDEFGDEDEKGSPRTTEVDPQQIPITTTPPTLTPPATTITTTFPETQTLPQPQPSPPPEQLEDKSELFQLVTQQRQRVEDEIRELEAQISTSPSDAIDDYLSALKQEGGDARIITCPRPPPPYPPVDSVLATLHRHIDDNRMEDSEQIQRVVVEEVDRVWDEYVRTGNIKLEPQVVEGEKEEEDLEGDDFEIGDDIDASNMELFANYIHDNTVALTHLVRETIRSTLCIPELKTPVGFVDTCRRGVYALEAKEFKVPKTKDALIAAVKRAIAPIPLEPKQVNGEKPQVLKNLTTHATWTCRPMDVVENILVPEIIQDELNWVNAWPEALLLQEECKDKIIAACLKDVLQNFDQAFKNC